jgi:vacuolar-type H+-ATPase subunit H
MEDRDVLQHLLEIEAKASVLVDDAQAEAGRRLKETEERNRSSYDQQYRSLVKELDREYEEQIGAVRSEYRQALDAYRTSLDTMPVNAEAFCTMVSSLLFAGGR